jgi:hypothetical protein
MSHSAWSAGASGWDGRRAIAFIARIGSTHAQSAGVSGSTPGRRRLWVLCRAFEAQNPPRAYLQLRSRRLSDHVACARCGGADAAANAGDRRDGLDEPRGASGARHTGDNQIATARERRRLRLLSDLADAEGVAITATPSQAASSTRLRTGCATSDRQAIVRIIGQPVRPPPGGDINIARVTPGCGVPPSAAPILGV